MKYWPPNAIYMQRCHQVLMANGQDLLSSDSWNRTSKISERTNSNWNNFALNFLSLKQKKTQKTKLTTNTRVPISIKKWINLTPKSENTVALGSKINKSKNCQKIKPPNPRLRDEWKNWFFSQYILSFWNHKTLDSEINN